MQDCRPFEQADAGECAFTEAHAGDAGFGGAGKELAEELGQVWVVTDNEDVLIGSAVAE